MLHAPKISKNLISVSQLASDNNIVIEFDSFCCNVKDKMMGKILIQRLQNEGLYKAQGAPKTICFLAEKDDENECSKRDLWHRTLGHPSEKVLNEVF